MYTDQSWRRTYHGFYFMCRMVIRTLASWLQICIRTQIIIIEVSRIFVITIIRTYYPVYPRLPAKNYIHIHTYIQATASAINTHVRFAIIQHFHSPFLIVSIVMIFFYITDHVIYHIQT
jgi:hypothetical protein